MWPSRDGSSLIGNRQYLMVENKESGNKYDMYGTGKLANGDVKYISIYKYYGLGTASIQTATKTDLDSEMQSIINSIKY